MKKISIVILNYLNYKDTIECIDSIFKMNYDFTGIVVVDNDSYNDSYKVLHDFYKKNKKIVVIKAKKNYGYAKGNNIGIKIAKERFHSDFVFVCNNDIIFTQADFFMRMLNHYEKDVAIIGPSIILKSGVRQNEFYGYITLRESILLYISLFLRSRNEDIWMNAFPNAETSKKVKILHGCALLFTPDFFKYYKGFYYRTFLYFEEVILYLMCQRYSLKQIYAKDATVYHKEDQSSKMSFNNDSRKMILYQMASYKYVIWWILKSKIKQWKCKKHRN